MSLLSEMKYLSKITKVPMAEMARNVGMSPNNFWHQCNRGSLDHVKYMEVLEFLGVTTTLEYDGKKIQPSIFYKSEEKQ